MTADFEDSVRQNQSMVFSIAYHFLRDRAAAEEVAQESFLELFTRLREFESPVHLRNWLRLVTSRRCIDQTRRKRTRAQISLDDAPEPFVWMPVEDPMLKQYIQQLIGALSDVPRLIVILRYQEDMSPTEIADLLEMPLSTVKSHLQRTLVLLRRKVEATAVGELR